MTVAERLSEVRLRIERAARACGRDPSSVKLVAVSKTKAPEIVREAYAAGQRDFGENYAQELVAKAEALGDLADLRWHFVGHVQTNKARIVARAAHCVHSLDSAPLTRELGKRAAAEQEAGRAGPLPVLVEVNLGGEAQRAGTSAESLGEVLAEVRNQPALALRGLMTIAPADHPELADECFARLAALRARHGGAQALPELSIGMTGDLEAAIKQGATLVRVGTAIFGARS